MDGSSGATRIAVLEPDAAARCSLARILRDAGYCPLLFESELDFLSEPDLGHIACLVADDALPVLSIVQMQLLLSWVACRPPAIFMSAHPTIDKAVVAIRGGAVDFLPKPVSTRDLLCAVRLAVHVAWRLRQNRQQRETVRARFAALTSREREVLEYVIAGRLNKQTAAVLGVGEKTVK